MIRLEDDMHYKYVHGETDTKPVDLKLSIIKPYVPNGLCQCMSISRITQHL